MPINASLKPGAEVPGVKAYRTTPGVAIDPVRVQLEIGDVIAAKNFDANDKEVSFTLDLKKGKTQMSAVFKTADGEEYGAYFAYVSKL